MQIIRPKWNTENQWRTQVSLSLKALAQIQRKNYTKTVRNHPLEDQAKTTTQSSEATTANQQPNYWRKQWPTNSNWQIWINTVKNLDLEILIGNSTFLRWARKFQMRMPGRKVSRKRAISQSCIEFWKIRIGQGHLFSINLNEMAVGCMKMLTYMESRKSNTSRRVYNKWRIWKIRLNSRRKKAFPSWTSISAKSCTPLRSWWTKWTWCFTGRDFACISLTKNRLWTYWRSSWAEFWNYTRWSTTSWKYSNL